MTQKAQHTPRPLGRFQLLRRLGEGGMGIVYEALDPDRNTKVAIKTMRSLTGEALLQFKKEFRALQDLEHPNFVHFHELLEDVGSWFFTMELINGTGFVEYVRGDQGSSPATKPSQPIDSISSARTLNATPSPVSSSADLYQCPEPLIPTSSRLPLPGSGSKVRFDENRLRQALTQLTYGLIALHEGGRIHRDVKPSNVMVTTEGRVVILDFGLVASMIASEDTTNHELAGTVDYMAPEQASAGKIGPEADWYSVGVVLYETLTQLLPFRGNPFEVMQAKQKLTPIPPRTLNPYVPPHLDTLCMELLDFDPRRRANGSTILSRLGVKPATEQVASSSTGRLVGAHFVGRREELQSLREQFQAMVKGTAAAVLVEGESGVGKSALVATFLERMKAETPQALVLAGRCYERESVPYKALDGVIDQLSKFLKHLEPSEMASVFPRHGRLLGAAFPVLRQVRAIAEAPAIRGEAQMSQQERRSRLFASVRDLFSRVADKFPVIIAIDDLQWADADSFALLTDILQPPAQPILLALATVRTGENVNPAFATFKAATLAGSHVRSIALQRLPEKDAQDLAGMLVGKLPDESRDRVLALTAEAGGHPLFIRELVLHAISQGSLTNIPQHLDEALWARVQSLTEGARKILELVSLAGKPIAQKTVSAASGIEGIEFSRGTSLLRVHCLVQTMGSRGSDKILPYHGRVCEAILARLDEETRRRHHHELAVALEAEPGHDTEMLAMHWHRAGDKEHALTYALLAASEAEQVLAFGRAADLYGMALEIGTLGDKEPDIKIKHAEALASAGRGAAAADAYLVAAQVNPKRELDLRRLAAEKYLHSGLVDKGLAEIQVVLKAFGIWYPPTAWAAIVMLLFWRAVLWVRGLSFRQRSETEVGLRGIRQLDALWSTVAGLSTVDHVRAAAFGSRMLFLALGAGEPIRLVRSLTMETILVSTEGYRAKRGVEKLLQLVETLASNRSGDLTKAMALGAAGFAKYNEQHYEAAISMFESAEDMFRDRCTGASWELGTVRWARLESLWFLGRLRELLEPVSLYLREALDRGDLRTAACLRLGVLNSIWLATDNHEAATRMCAEGTASWTFSGFQLQHWLAMVAESQISLYVGRPEEAYEQIRTKWPALVRSHLLRGQVCRSLAFHLRGRCCIAFAKRCEGTRRAELLGEATRWARALCSERIGWPQAMGQQLLASVALQDNDTTTAMAGYQNAARLLDSVGSRLDGAIARRAEGILVGGVDGRQLVASADAFIAGADIKNPKGWIAMAAPGLEDL